MNIEFLEFYPIAIDEENETLSGSLRIKLPEIGGIQLLGVFVARRKDSWFVSLPGKKSIDHRTGKEVRFPFVSFGDKEKMRDLMNSIREGAPDFIEKRLNDSENPISLCSAVGKK